MTTESPPFLDHGPRVLICGSRSWTDVRTVQVVLNSFRARYGEALVVIHGANPRGADRMAAEWARAVGADSEPYPAAWTEHHPNWCPGPGRCKPSYCVAAGPRRNQRMLDEGHPDVVVGFSVVPVTSGTRDMLTRAGAAGVAAYRLGPISA